MIVYTAHEPARPAQSIEERADNVVFVKEGFAWLGFFFPPLWLLFNRLWLEFIAALAVASVFAAGAMQLGYGQLSASLADALLMLIVGFEGNNLRRWKLERQGYVFLASVAGRDFEDCERRFFEAWLPFAAGGGSGASPALLDLKPAGGQRAGEWPTHSAIGTLPGAL